MKKRILVALDGSMASLRVVAHAGNIIGGCEGFQITLCHVFEVPTVPPIYKKYLERGGEPCQVLGRGYKDSLQVDRVRVEEAIFIPAKQILEQKGVVDVQTKLRWDTTGDIAQEIIQETKAGKYDAVALGRRGHSMVMAYVLGSVTSKVVHHIGDSAVWVVE